MADQDNDQKTELPTERHLSEAVERGQIAKSPELNVVLSMAAAIGVLAFTSRTTADSLAEYSISIFSSFASTHVDSTTVTAQMGALILVVGKALAPVFVATVGAALISNGFQNGFQLTPKALGIKWEALSPSTGLGRIFSKSTLVRSGIDLMKLLAIGFALYAGARTFFQDPLFTSPVESAYLGRFLYQASVAFLTRLLFSLGVIAAISYAWEKFKTSKELMMTREEVKDDRRSTEGNQLMKGAMRRMARRLMQKQMLSAVPTADVVVTNPTHFAVALKYERGKDKAPVVLAKGDNRFAQRIKAIAAEHGVPVVENKPVARVLFAMGKVGEVIPPELYQAVAEILAVVYRTHRYYFHELKARRLEGTA
jgi:flagellar biosynthetic protein FlhB